MNTEAPPFKPVPSMTLAAAQDRVDHHRRELQQAERDLARLQVRQLTKTTPPPLVVQRQQARCTYCTGYHPSYAGIGGCIMKSPCAICGGDHKAGKRGENHARFIRAQRRAAGSEVSSPPTSPTGSIDQGGSIVQSGSVDDDTATCGRCSDDEPDIEPEPDSDVQVAAAARASIAAAAAAEPSWTEVVRGKRGQALQKRSAQGEMRTGPKPQPGPAPQHRPAQLQPGWSAYGYPVGQRPNAKPNSNQRSAQGERDSNVPTEPNPPPDTEQAALPAFYRQSVKTAEVPRLRVQNRQAGRDFTGANLDPGDFPYRGRPGCSCCGDSTPADVSYAPRIYDSMHGAPLDCGYRNVYVCGKCMLKKPAYKDIFTGHRMLRAPDARSPDARTRHFRRCIDILPGRSSARAGAGTHGDRSGRTK